MIETQKVRRHDKFRKERSQQMQVPNGAGPDVRRIKRPLLPIRTRCNVLSIYHKYIGEMTWLVCLVSYVTI